MSVNKTERELSLVKEISEKSSPCKLTHKFIRCPDCGEEIRIAQSLTEMVEAIENHLTAHRKPSRNEIAAPYGKKMCIRQDLTDQVLQRAAEMGEVPFNESIVIRLG